MTVVPPMGSLQWEVQWEVQWVAGQFEVFPSSPGLAGGIPRGTALARILRPGRRLTGGETKRTYYRPVGSPICPAAKLARAASVVSTSIAAMVSEAANAAAASPSRAAVSTRDA